MERGRGATLGQHHTSMTGADSGGGGGPTFFEVRPP